MKWNNNVVSKGRYKMSMIGVRIHENSTSKEKQKERQKSKESTTYYDERARA